MHVLSALFSCSNKQPPVYRAKKCCFIWSLNTGLTVLCLSAEIDTVVHSDIGQPYLHETICLNNLKIIINYYCMKLRLNTLFVSTVLCLNSFIHYAVPSLCQL